MNGQKNIKKHFSFLADELKLMLPFNYDNNFLLSGLLDN